MTYIYKVTSEIKPYNYYNALHRTVFLYFIVCPHFCIHNNIIYICSEKSQIHVLRLDNTGGWVVEVFPSYLSNQMTENVDLYIK